MISNLSPYSRRDLEVWRSGKEWRYLATRWLEQQVQVHGKHNFRRRKGGARGVKELGEEVLPLAKLARVAPRGSGFKERLRCGDGSTLVKVLYPDNQDSRSENARLLGFALATSNRYRGRKSSGTCVPATAWTIRFRFCSLFCIASGSSYGATLSQTPLTIVGQVFFWFALNRRRHRRSTREVD